MEGSDAQTSPCPCLQLALDYIGKRGSTVGVTQSKRIEYAREILQKEMLPHMGIQPNCQASKVRPMWSAGLQPAQPVWACWHGSASRSTHIT